jgi:hypothetical protein
MMLVRIVIFVALAVIAGAALLYLFSKDRRYLRFIAQVVRFTIVLFVVVMLMFAFERLVAPAL